MTSIEKGVPTVSHWFLLVIMHALLVPPLVARAADNYCSICSCNGDRDGDGSVTVDEVITAVNNVLDGCPALQWQQGCGPIHPGSDPCPAAVNLCTSEQLGESCDYASASCCPPDSDCQGYECNTPLVCAVHPAVNCPVSRRAYKRDVEYLGRSDIDALRRQLLAFKLARYRYKTDAQSTPAHLGFIIDDIEPSPAVNESGNAVDLYGYVSMAVATVQAQSSDIDAMKREIDELHQQLNGLKAAAREKPKRHAKP